jgi:hypothetical protein
MNIDRNEARQRADRADAVIGWASAIGLAFLLLTQLLGKLA